MSIFNPAILNSGAGICDLIDDTILRCMVDFERVHHESDIGNIFPAGLGQDNLPSLDLGLTPGGGRNNDQKLMGTSKNPAEKKVKLRARYFEGDGTGDSETGQQKRETGQQKRKSNVQTVNLHTQETKQTKRKFQPKPFEDTKEKQVHHKQEEKKKKPYNPKRFQEVAGFIEYESDEEVDQRLTQSEIQHAVDVTSAQKHFDLNLKDFGPYWINYSRNGRHLLLGGAKGHCASFDWQTKRLSCEFNAMETVNCVRWLHQETFFTTAQRTGVFVYDNQGIELHALENLDCVLRMEFLPYHMLLVTANEKGFLAYTDVSLGTRVTGICTGLGRLDTMTQNPSNAIVMLGHAAGTVTMWTPNHREPVVKMLCHKAPVRAIAVDKTGNYLATSGVDKRVKVFDLRTKKLLNASHVSVGASSLAFSQRGLLAAGLGNRVQVFKDVRLETDAITPYLSHVCRGHVQQVQFCPFEDVLGVGHQQGFTSLLVPGSGEPNFDALEVNPMTNKKQRQHAEVRLLLDKIQPEMISLENWITELSKRQMADTKKPAQKKLGKKEKETAFREVRKEKLAAATAASTEQQRKATVDDADPLSRFRKH